MRRSFEHTHTHTHDLKGNLTFAQNRNSVFAGNGCLGRGRNWLDGGRLRGSFRCCDLQPQLQDEIAFF